MMRVQTFLCSLAKDEADALNRESGRVYTTVLVWHYRIYRHTGHWLSEHAAKRLEDSLGGATTLHARTAEMPPRKGSMTPAKSPSVNGNWGLICTTPTVDTFTARQPGKPRASAYAMA